MQKSKKGMERAYRVAGELLRDRLREKSPKILEELEKIKEADVIITRGQYDHIESVLRQSGTPFTLVSPSEIDKAELRPDQIVFVNCPGRIRSKGFRNLATFVEQGGFLFTTDWALKHVLERAFPGIVEYNKQATKDDVVRVEVLDIDDPFLASILGPEDDPQWWLEGSSYPIRVLDKERVKVLVSSRELKERYGEAPVFISFDHGEGKVYHMISHFYLQRTEARNERHLSDSERYLKEKGIRKERMKKYAKMGIDDLTTGEVESAYSSQGMMSKVLWEKSKQRRRNQKRGKDE